MSLPLLGNLVAESCKVVPRASAVVPGQADAEPIVIYADHKNMVKFPSKQDVGYTTVSEHLQIMMVDAEGIIRSRWEAEFMANNGECLSNICQSYMANVYPYIR